MIRVFFIFLLSHNTLYSQTKPESISDTSKVVGIISEDYFAGLSVDELCMTRSDKFFARKTPIMISGTKVCRGKHLVDSLRFYEVAYDGKVYYLPFKTVLTKQNVFELIEAFDSNQKVKFRDKAVEMSKLLLLTTKQEALKFLEGCKAKGLAILDWSFYDQSDYTEGTGVRIKIYNPTAKVIKYITFTFVAFNPVGDKITDKVRGSNISMKGVGPIKPGESGSYNYEYVWFTDLVESVRIMNIRIQYMDGTIKSVNNPKDIILSSEHYRILFEEE